MAKTYKLENPITKDAIQKAIKGDDISGGDRIDTQCIAESVFGSFYDDDIEEQVVKLLTDAGFTEVKEPCFSTREFSINNDEDCAIVGYDADDQSICIAPEMWVQHDQDVWYNTDVCYNGNYVGSRWKICADSSDGDSISAHLLTAKKAESLFKKFSSRYYFLQGKVKTYIRDMEHEKIKAE